MTMLRILIHHAKHGDALWLADTKIRAAQAREILFEQLDEQGCYEADEEGLLEKARAGDAGAIEIILDSRRGYEYEDWDYEYIEVPCNGGVPGLAELLDFDTYQKAAHATAEYPPEVGIYYAALGLAGEGGEVANQVKKIARDDAGCLTAARKLAIKKELGGVLWYVAEVATLMGIPLADVSAANLQQLHSRKARGTIKGDGDNR